MEEGKSPSLNDSEESRLYENEGNSSIEDEDMIRYYEFEIKPILPGEINHFAPDCQTFLNIVDITSLIKTHQLQCDMAY